MQKEAISVYDPSDPIEKAIQDAFHETDPGWLPSYPCRLLADAISSAKVFDDNWLRNPILLTHRISYFFNPVMNQSKETMVFLTHLIFLRDILENRNIDSYLHSPVLFVTVPIARYLFREYPIHIHVNMDLLKADNPNVDFEEVGATLISDRQDVKVSDNTILRVHPLETKTDFEQADSSVVMGIQEQTGFETKVAVSLIGDGVFQIDTHEREIYPDDRIFDKKNSSEGVILAVEPGDTGLVYVNYDDGDKTSISKEQFDTRFIIV